MVSWTVIAATGERFVDFAPYVGSVNDAGLVAFQAALRDGRHGVFTGEGGDVAAVALPDKPVEVISHPDVNVAGDTCFYAELAGGAQCVYLVRQGSLSAIADTRDGYKSIGPLGPTMNEAGTVAFRADLADGVNGVFAGNQSGVKTIADSADRWSAFHGLPVITERGSVVFRADGRDGVQGIYSGLDGSIEAEVETGDRFETIAPFPSANDHGVVAFAATVAAGRGGTFTTHDGRTTQIVDTDDGFESCRGALITNTGQVISIATPRDGGLGFFAGPDPDADRILAVGDTLFGSTVEEVVANPVSVNTAGQLAVRVRLVEGRQLILRADP